MPKAQAKQKVLAVRVSAAEQRQIKAAADSASMKLGTWARSALLAAARGLA
jgi:hypothetical protein